MTVTTSSQATQQMAQAEEVLQRVAEVILAYLERSSSPDQAYLPLFQQIALGAIEPPHELAEAVKGVRSSSHLDAATTSQGQLAAHLLRDEPLRHWLAAQDLGGDRADFIDHFVLYASCVGPALGQALLRMTNPRHMVLLMLRVVTPGAFRNTGQWPDEPPQGERWDVRAGDWAVDASRPWEPVATEIIRARIAADQGSGDRRVFPEGFGKDAARLNVSNLLLDAALSLRNELNKLAEGPLAPLLDVPADFPDHPTALEVAFPTALPHDLVGRCDYTAARREGWSCTPVVDGSLLAADLIRATDARARTLSHSPDPQERALGQRIVGASIQNLVWAGALLAAGAATQEDALGQWPFTFEGTDARPPAAPADLERTLARYLGGKAALVLWSRSK